MNLEKQKLWVCLNSSENPTRLIYGSENQKREEFYKNVETVYFEVSSLKEASEVCQRYIDYFELGSGNWDGGRVIDDNNNFVARISYNGRVWDADELGKGKEIEI